MDDDTIIDEYADVLQNLETAIVQADDRVQQLSDGQVELALEALIRYYQAEERGHEPRPPRLGEGAQAVFDAVKPMAEWRLGRTELQEVIETEGEDEAEIEEMTPDEISEFVTQVIQEALAFADEGLADEGLADEGLEDDELEDEAFSDEGLEAKRQALSGLFEPISHEILIACLKRIRKSVRFWNKQGGRRGYLTYIEKFLAGDSSDILSAL
jgi:hypothetical protein